MLAALEPLAMSLAGYALAIALGLLWGSFANVCIYRWPSDQSVIAPGSRCAACQAPIRWYDNVPVVAWLWLGGRCRACRASFSARYLVVEAVTGALFGVAWWDAVIASALFVPFELRLLHFAIYAAFCLAMVVIAFIDLDHQLILDKITLPSIPVFYLASFAWPERRWYDGVVGMAAGYAIPWAIGAIWLKIRKIEAMGRGDSKLLAMVGALLGWQGAVIGLFGGGFIGAFVATTAVIVARRREARASAESPTPAEPTSAELPSQADPPSHTAAAPGTDPGAGAQEENPSLGRTEFPFGPFLAMAAVLYLFAEPWFHIEFHLPL